MTSLLLILLHVKNQLTTNLLFIASISHHISNGLKKILGCCGVGGLIFKPRRSWVIRAAVLRNIQMCLNCIFGIQVQRPVYDWSCAYVSGSCCWGPPDVWERHWLCWQRCSSTSHYSAFLCTHIEISLNEVAYGHTQAPAYNTNTYSSKKGVGLLCMLKSKLIFAIALAHFCNYN